MTPEQAAALVALDPSALEQASHILKARDTLGARQWLDQQYSREVALAILDCVSTQAHFATKFVDASRWLLSREAAEQATPSKLACWRSQYLRQRFPEAASLQELGTGIGGDSVFLAREFSLEGYEQEQARATLARENIARLSPGITNFHIHNESVKVSSLPSGLLFADPARRGQGRVFDPQQWQPPLSEFLAAAGEHGIVLKTAPGLDLSLIPEGMEVHFLSLSGELKEAMLLKPSLSSPSSAPRHAWLWTAESPTPRHRSGTPRLPGVHPPQIGHYIHNPDPALLRAGLLADLCEELAGGLVHPQIAYLCGPHPCPDSWASSFCIQESFPLQWKRLSEALQASSWSEFEVLFRGVPFSVPEILERTRQVRKRMKGRNGGRGSVILYRDGRGYHAVLAQRMTPNQSAAV